MKYMFELRAWHNVMSATFRAYCVFVAISCLPASASTLEVQDQFFPGSNAALMEVSPNVELAQTFPVTLDGFLNSLGIWISLGSADFTADLFWDVRPTVNGVPVASDDLVLSSGTINNEDIPVFPELLPTRIDLSSSKIRVEPGDLLAITVRTNEEKVAWRIHLDGNPADTFLRNFSDQSWSSISLPDRSFGFATYVLLVPEPSSVAVLSVGLFVAASAVRRRHYLSCIE